MTDAQARKKIIKDINTNFFVEAGAGSGKTTVLVERMVAMVESGISVDKICTITFTKAAANEFYERFQKRLIERSVIPQDFEEVEHKLPKPTKESVLRCQKALEDIDLCFMGTIDSFCNMILSEHPSEANIPSDARLIDDKQASEIYKQFYLGIKNKKHGDELYRLAGIFARVHTKPEDTFALLMKEIMDRRNVEFASIDFPIENNIQKTFSKVRNDLIKVLNKFDEDPSKIVLKLGKNDDRDPYEVFLNYKATIQKGWQYNYNGVIKTVKALSDLTYEASPDELGFTNESVVRENAGNTILNVKDEDNPKALYYELMNYKYQVTLDLLKQSIPYLEKQMRQNGQFTFFDYLYYLRNMLKTDASKEGKLINYIYNRHSYFMIDEFQDTNPMQAEVFFYLASEKPVSDWKKCKPRPGSLFIVGDPKQSIYRFRSADVSSYLKIKEMFNNGVGEVLLLTNNFRSRNIVKSYFNDVFEEVMPEETSDQAAYEDIENTRADEQSEFEGIYTYDAYSEKLLSDYPDMDDYSQMSKIIKSLVNNENFKIKDKTLSYKDFMIIFAGKTNIAGCIEKFKEEEIPARVEGKVLFEDCEGLKAITNIYKAITNTEDIISLISALYSPIFGINENDLSLYKKQGKKLKLVDREYDDSLIDKALEKLNNEIKYISLLTPSSLYEKIMDDLEIFKYVSSDNLEIVYYSLELLRNEESSGNIVTFEDAITYLDELLSGDSGLERCLSLKENVDAVHIANLHKVKGLEAPVVILAKSGPTKSNPDIRIEYSNDENIQSKGYYIVKREKGENNHNSIIETNLYKEEAAKEKTSLKSENDRLVYVAATRARNVLIVAKPFKRSSKGLPVNDGNRWKVLSERTGQDIFEYIGETKIIEKKIHDQVKAEQLYSDSLLTSKEAKLSYEIKSPSTLKSFSKYDDLSEIKEGTDENDGETYSTLIGTMVHRMMEMIIMSKDKMSKNEIIQNIISDYVTVEFESYINTFKDKLSNVYDVMHNGGFIQKGKVEQDILPILLSAEEVYSEIPFTYKEENIIWNGIIDLMYKKNGKLHIIDWKTNKNDDGLDEHYKGQLNAYINAAKDIIGEKVETALIYHIEI